MFDFGCNSAARMASKFSTTDGQLLRVNTAHVFRSSAKLPSGFQVKRPAHVLINESMRISAKRRKITERRNFTFPSRKRDSLTFGFAKNCEPSNPLKRVHFRSYNWPCSTQSNCNHLIYFGFREPCPIYRLLNLGRF